MLPAEPNFPRVLGDQKLGKITNRTMLTTKANLHSPRRTGRRWYCCARLRSSYCLPGSRRSHHCRYARCSHGYHACSFTGSQDTCQKVPRCWLEGAFVSCQNACDVSSKVVLHDSIQSSYAFNIIDKMSATSLIKTRPTHDRSLL